MENTGDLNDSNLSRYFTGNYTQMRTGDCCDFLLFAYCSW